MYEWQLECQDMRMIVFVTLMSISFAVDAQLFKNKQTADIDTTADYSFEYRTRNNVMIVPAVINNSIRVNLILDPYCKTMILFGNRFKKMLGLEEEEQNDQSEDPGQLISYDNRLAIGGASGKVTIIVLPNKDAVNFVTGVHGVIGYEFLSNYDITIDRKNLMMSVKPKDGASPVGLARKPNKNFSQN
jgi:hypothetical protein